MAIEQKKLGYFSSLDLLRGLASVAVIFFHFTHGNKGYLSPDNFLYVIGRYGFLGVDVFFVISGFVIPYAMYRGRYKLASFGRFMVKRVVRIEPPYLISIVMVLVLNYLSTFSPNYGGEPFNLDFTRLALHVGYFNAFSDYPWYNDVYWTLAIEFQYYIVVALIFPLLLHPKKYISIITLTVFAILGAFITDHSFIFNYGLLFIVGILMFQFQVGYLKKGEFGLLLLIVLIMIFAKFDKRYLIAALLPYFFIMYFDFGNSFSRFLGNISYSLYLVHIPIGGRVINLTKQLTEDEFTRSIFVFVAMAVSIFASWVFFKLIEKPTMLLSKKLTYQKKKGS
jgi:peptidoglycan/LPS O-acetylase OafA/YrhL